MSNRNVNSDYKAPNKKQQMYNGVWTVEALAAELMRAQAAQNLPKTVWKDKFHPFIIAQPEFTPSTWGENEPIPYWTVTIDWFIDPKGLPIKKGVMVGESSEPMAQDSADAILGFLDEIKEHLKAQLEVISPELELQVN